MLCGHSKVWLYWSVVSDVSLGKSSPSPLVRFPTSHDQWGWSILLITECVLAHLNGLQFRHVYSITHTRRSHSQTRHENSTRMPFYRTEVIWEKACLVITPCEWECSSIQMKRDGSCNSLDSNHPSQSLSTHPHSQSQSQSSQKRNNDPSTVILLPREAVHSNLHTVEKTHPSQNQLIYSRETLISNLQLTKRLESRQVQLSVITVCTPSIVSPLYHSHSRQTWHE